VFVFAALALVLVLAWRLGDSDEGPPAATNVGPKDVQQLTIQSDYGQIYITDAEGLVEPQTENDNSLMRSLDDASESRRFVGFDRMINVLTPSQYNWEAPLTLEVWDRQPPVELERWDHVVEGPFPAPSGTIYFEASGGGKPIEVRIPPGTYRARVSGAGFVAGVGEIEGHERWRLQLWPAAKSKPELLKNWAGWELMRPR
jgi:hypothetical protein